MERQCPILPNRASRKQSPAETQQSLASTWLQLAETLGLTSSDQLAQRTALGDSKRWCLPAAYRTFLEVKKVLVSLCHSQDAKFPRDGLVKTDLQLGPADTLT